MEAPYGYLGGSGTLALGSSAMLENLTFADNRTEHAIQGLGSRLEMINSRLWENGAHPIQTDGPERVLYSAVEGGYPGTGNIDAGPLLRGDRPLLGAASPCIDAGDPDLQDAVWDRHPLWPPRHSDGPRSDIGAYGEPGALIWLPRYGPGAPNRG